MMLSKNKYCFRVATILVILTILQWVITYMEALPRSDTAESVLFHNIISEKYMVWNAFDAVISLCNIDGLS